MRAREFLRENNRQGDRAHGFGAVDSDPMNLTLAFPGLPGNNAYRAYRFAMAMANHEIDYEDGPTSQLAVISAYTDGDEKIIRAAMKKTGERALTVANRGSRESDSINRHSPVARIKQNRWGV